jgi:CRP-like cAMP-binding protein
MVPVELTRRYPFFAGFSHDQLVTLAKAGNELSVEAGHHFFYEEDQLISFYLVLKGTVAITINIPDRDVLQPLSNQITNDLITRDVTVSTVGEGELFGWSALVPPNFSTANAKATTPCRVVEFNYKAIQPYIEDDCCFGHLLTLKVAQIIRGRLRDRRIESLAEVAI